MPMLDWKVKMAVLWLLQPVNFAAYIFIHLSVTKSFGDANIALAVAVSFFIPCALAWVSVAWPHASRWPNIVVGSLFALLKLSGTLGRFPPLTPAVFFNELWALVAASAVIWYAWRLPRIVGAD
jgi:hypothetical protein